MKRNGCCNFSCISSWFCNCIKGPDTESLDADTDNSSEIPDFDSFFKTYEDQFKKTMSEVTHSLSVYNKLNLNED